MRFLSCFVALIMFGSTSFGQVKAYMDVDWFRHNAVVDGKKVPFAPFVGFSGMEEAMKSNPEASALAGRASTQMLVSNIFLLAAVALPIGYLNSNRDNWNSGTYWGLFAAGIIPAIVLQGASQINFNKAINTYNGVKETASLTPEFSLMPVTGGAGGLLSWSF